MFSVLVIRLRSLRLLRVSGIVMRLRMFLLLITFLKASHSFRNRLLVICKNAYLFATMIMTSVSSPFSFFFSSRRRHTIWTGDWSSDVCSSDLCGWSGHSTIASTPAAQGLGSTSEKNGEDPDHPQLASVTEWRTGEVLICWIDCPRTITSGVDRKSVV